MYYNSPETETESQDGRRLDYRESPSERETSLVLLEVTEYSTVKSLGNFFKALFRVTTERKLRNLVFELGTWTVYGCGLCFDPYHTGNGSSWLVRPPLPSGDLSVQIWSREDFDTLARLSPVLPSPSKSLRQSVGRKRTGTHKNGCGLGTRDRVG